MASEDDTIVAPATPRGPGETAVVRLAGARAAEIADRRVSPDRGEPRLTGIRRGTVRGRWRFERSEAEVAVVVHVQRAPRSFTGVDQVEIFLPGAPVLVETVVRDLVKLGARVAEPGEFTKRAFLNGKIDLMQAEAVAAMIRASGDADLRAARTLLDGGLSKELSAIADRVLSVLTPVELAIDFSDQDITIVEEQNVAHRIRSLAEDLATFVGKKSSRGKRTAIPRVVLRGPANAGKSSLFNALIGEDRSITAPVRGTTRDVVEREINLGDQRIVLVNTAGDDVSEHVLDRMAQEKRVLEEERADLVVSVRDGGLAGSATEGPGVSVRTHADLHPTAAATEFSGTIWTSAVSGFGLDRLCRAIRERLDLAPGGESSALALNERHIDGVERARSALLRAADAVERGLGLELTAADLRDALAALRELTGADYSDLLLDRIMRDFCIGK